jgi:predicted transcriptional regulator
MSTAKQKMSEIIQSQPDDASYEEIMREFAFERMVERGLDDSREGRVVSNKDMKHRIRSWRNKVDIACRDEQVQ